MLRIAYILILCFISISMNIKADSFETAQEFVKNCGAGWNLGNTLDSHKEGVTKVADTEVLRGQPKTSQELMNMMRMAGFGTIRVPVTWYPHMDAEGNIDPEWMARVKEVVDYVINAGMYCIINVHHDTGKTDPDNPQKGWLRALNSNYETNHKKFEHIWTQIAETFKDYDHHLLFEGYNEMLEDQNSWNYPSYNMNNRWNDGKASSAYSGLNKYAKSFVTAVRATGGNNTQRNLIINTYAAAGGGSTASLGEHYKEVLTKLNKPEDSDHILASVHLYPSIYKKDETDQEVDKTEQEIQTMIDYMCNHLDEKLAQRGMPVIIGEWGSSNVDADPTDYAKRRNLYLSFVKYFVQKAKQKNIAMVYWMGLSNGRAPRSYPYFSQADLAETILKGYHGDDYEPALIRKEDYGNVFCHLDQWNEVRIAFDNKGRLASDYVGIEIELDNQTFAKDNVILRTRPMANGTEYHNRLDITESNTYFKLDTIVGKVYIITIVSKINDLSLNFKRVQLVKADGTKVDCELQLFYSNKGTLIPTPNFAWVNIGNTGYATLYYGENNLRVPQNVEASTYKINNGWLQKVGSYSGNGVIPSATGVVLQGEPNAFYKFDYTTETAEPAVGNMLRGSDVDAMTTGGSRYYMLSLDAEGTPNSVGFYYVNDSGSAFMNKAHKAYLAVPVDESFANQYIFEDVLGIEDSFNDSVKKDTNKYYTIDGRQLISKPTDKGIYIYNGKKLIII